MNESISEISISRDTWTTDAIEKNVERQFVAYLIVIIYGRR